MHVLKKYMRVRRFSLLEISLPLLMGFSFAFAQEARDEVGLMGSDSTGGKVKEKAAQVLKPGEVDHAGSKIERWYTYWALGYDQMNYTGNMDGISVGLSSFPSGIKTTDSDYSVGFDLFGFYLPLKNHQTLIGAVYNLAINHRSPDINDTPWEKWKGHQLSASTMHFFKSIGKGFFVRADLGFGWIAGHNNEEEQLLGAADSGGLAGLLGIGYAFPVEDKGASILLNLNYFVTPIVDFSELEGDVRGYSVTVGGLF